MGGICSLVVALRFVLLSLEALTPSQIWVGGDNIADVVLQGSHFVAQLEKLETRGSSWRLYQGVDGQDHVSAASKLVSELHNYCQPLRSLVITIIIIQIFQVRVDCPSILTP